MNNRLIELDVLRGLSVFGMILVINPGHWSHQFQWMQHAEWQGYPLSDMIFPAFLFCVGVSMAFSFSRKIEKGATYKSLFIKSLQRSLLMILIGLFINAFPYFDWSHMRIPGVIQRIGICYLLVSNLYLIILFSKTKSNIGWLLASVALVLVGYFVLLAYIPIPVSGVTKIGDVYIWPAIIDQFVFGVEHIWAYGKIDGVVPYDPDGLLASLPACVNVLFGVIIGVLILDRSPYYQFTYLLFGGLVLMMFSFLLDYYSIMPIIKKLWTSSFVLFSTGVSLVFLALIKWVVENIKMGKKLLHPFIVFGSNALLAFIVSYLCMSLMDMTLKSGTTIRQIGFHFFLNLNTNVKWASFFYSLVPLVVYFIGLQILYNKRWFVKL